MGVQTPKMAPTRIRHEWRTEAVCRNRDPRIWSKKDTTLAEAYCRACPVLRECLQDALGEPEAEQWTVRGGFTPPQLRSMIRQGLTVTQVMAAPQGVMAVVA